MTMKKPQTDFDYMQKLVEDFFKRASIKSALQVIASQSITGWEVWFQIEFARFLTEHESEPEWLREYALEYDWRKEKHRSYFKPDFIIRKKGWALDRYIALEMKQHAQIGNCLSNMAADLVKVARIRESQLNVRSIWALGVFPTDEDSNLEEMIQTKLEAIGQSYYSDRVLAARINKTPFSYALF